MYSTPIFAFLAFLASGFGTHRSRRRRLRPWER